MGGIYEIHNGQARLYIFANGQRIAIIQGTQKYFYHTDHLGSTTLVTDENGQVKDEIGYLPFGALLYRHDYSGGQWVSTYRFTSQEYDSEYALYNYNARLYDPIAKIQMAQAAIHAGAGVVSGGINAAITGANVGQGMLVGGLSAGLSKWTGIDSLPGRTVFGAAVGGITAELSGGDFAQGAFIGAWTTAFAYVFNERMHRIIIKTMSDGFEDSWKSLMLAYEEK